MARIYLDFNASTPISTPVADAMRALIGEAYGNPSSRHWAGIPAREALTTARRQVADLLGCAPEEVVFTSGGSEANNLALKGVFFARTEPERVHIVTTSIEHPAILAPCRFLETLGARVTYLPVDRTGRVDPEQVHEAIRDDTLLVTIMHANNEVGTVQPIAEIAAIARERGVRMHTDAAQSVGKIPTRVDELGVDLLSVAGHKLCAPKGIGALYVRRGTALEPLIHGAGHEHGLRAGTESVLLAAALGEASASAPSEVERQRMRHLRDRLLAGLQGILGQDVVLNGHPEHRLPNTLNVGFRGRVGTDVLALLPDVAASTGSACHEGAVQVSPVLEAMGIEPEVAGGAVRFSLGASTTEAEIDSVLAAIDAAHRNGQL